MKVVCISDTHERHKLLSPLPKGDLLIHAGDFTLLGEYAPIKYFMDWLSEEAKAFPMGAILIAGNHDLSLDPNMVAKGRVSPEEHKKALALVNSKSNVTYLNDESLTLEDPHTHLPIRVWGSPVQPFFHDWGFNKQRGDEISLSWDKIPENTEILITHGPPLYLLDTVKPNSVSLGCFDLARKIIELPNLKLHVFGHIHGGHGMLKRGSTIFINASSLNEVGSPNSTISVEVI